MRHTRSRRKSERCRRFSITAKVLELAPCLLRRIGIGGEPHGPAPPTPPCIRVRTRRFGKLIGLLGTREGRPSAASEALRNARVRAGLLLSRQGPCGLPAVCAARSRPTPRRRSSANRVRPRFHCFQGTARSRRLVQWSSPRNTDGVSQKPK